MAAAELCKHGFNVTPTSRNMVGADLLITDDACRTTWTIQVKVAAPSFKPRRGWLIGRHAARTANKAHAYVFVLLKGRGLLTELYRDTCAIVADRNISCLAKSLPADTHANTSPG